MRYRSSTEDCLTVWRQEPTESQPVDAAMAIVAIVAAHMRTVISSPFVGTPREIHSPDALGL